MQTPIPPILTGTSAPAPKSKTNAAAPDNDFQRTLSRQMEQRQNVKNASGARAQGAQPARQEKAAAPAAPARPADKTEQADPASPADASAGSAAAAAPSGDAPAPSDKGAGEEQAALAAPVTDMLALVASLNLPAVPVAPPVAAAEAGPAALTAGARAAQAFARLKAEPATQSETAALPEIEAEPQAAALPAAPQLDTARLVAARDATPAAKEPLPGIGGVAAPLPQAALEVARAASAAIPGDKLNGRVGSPVWDQQVGQKIVWMVGKGELSATLTLNPPDLGPLQVVLNVTNDHTDAAFTSSRPEVRQALEAAMPRLREMMNDAGMQLGNASVSAGMSDRRDGAEAGAERGRGARIDSDSGSDAAASRGAAAAVRTTVQGVVDTFA